MTRPRRLSDVPLEERLRQLRLLFRAQKALGPEERVEFLVAVLDACPLERRRLAVAHLRAAEGLSLRSIAVRLETSLGAVQRDLAAVGLTDTPDFAVGLDGRRYPSGRAGRESDLAGAA